MRPSFPRSLLVVPLVVAAVACGGAQTRPEPPPFQPKNQTRCAVSKSQSRPLIVEWPSADRGELEDRARRSGLVVVRYAGCEMEMLPQCTAPGSYVYSALTRKHDRLAIKDTDELCATIPVGAPKLEATLARTGQLSVAMTIVGRYNADRATVRQEDLQGDCARATHVVSALTAGAFLFSAGAADAVGAGVQVAGAGAGARSTSSVETLAQDGDEQSCERSSDQDARPPSGCGALLRIEVVPIVGEAPAPALATGPAAATVVPRTAATPAAPSPAATATADRDKDGIADRDDKCPDVPEDLDGFEDDDGCPDSDNDRDGVPDPADQCPNEAETRNGFEDNDGCPDGTPKAKSHVGN